MTCNEKSCNISKVCRQSNKWKKQLKKNLQNKSLSKNRTFLHSKSFKVQKLLYSCIKNKNQPKDPSSFPKKRLQANKKMVRVLKKIKIPRNLPKFQVIQPY